MFAGRALVALLTLIKKLATHGFEVTVWSPTLTTRRTELISLVPTFRSLVRSSLLRNIAGGCEFEHVRIDGLSICLRAKEGAYIVNRSQLLVAVGVVTSLAHLTIAMLFKVATTLRFILRINISIRISISCIYRLGYIGGWALLI